nr:MAG TPA: hypothetical protein [Caudoviricetes sp.]DAV51054.1 MAG TPA: hypothetical protein [Bacteriophage sp.]
MVIRKYKGCILASPEPFVITSNSFRFGWSYPTKGTTLFIIYLHSKIKTNRQA